MNNNHLKYLDGAKAGLIFLVIVGHFSKLYINQSMTLAVITTFIYAFHMPVFSFISGLLTKKSEFKTNGTLQILRLYIIFHVLYNIFNWLFMGNMINLNPLFPVDITWYLLALFLWRTFVPYFKNNRLSFFISVVISCIAGWFDLTPGLNLTFGFLPFFILGYVTNKEHLKNVITSKKLSIAAMMLSLFAVLCIAYGKYWIFPSGSIFYFFWKPYDTFGQYAFGGVFFRLSAQILAVVLGYFYLIFTSKLSLFYRKKVQMIGTYSIYPYLFHYFFVTIIWVKVPYTKGLTQLITIMGAIIIAWVLSTEKFKNITKIIVRH